MDNKKLISEIYNQTVIELLLGIEEKYKKEICLSYVDYLKKKYLNFDLNLQQKKPEEIINIFVDLEKSKWKNMNAEMKLSELLKDPAFENIKYISNMGYKYAEMRSQKNFNSNDEMLLSPVIDDSKAQSSIEMLYNCYQQVRDFNKNIANYYVSEGIMDFQYASGITENMSLRIGRMN